MTLLESLPIDEQIAVLDYLINNENAKKTREEVKAKMAKASAEFDINTYEPKDENSVSREELRIMMGYPPE